MKGFLSLNFIKKPNYTNIYQSLKREKIHFLLAVILLLFLGIAIIGKKQAITFKEESQRKKIENSPFALPNQIFYPILYATASNVWLAAEAAIVVDDDSKVILFEKNSSKKLPMASTAKIMTALTGLMAYQLSDILTVKSTFTEGSVIGLQTGEQMTFEDLLYAMLLPSGNDAAYVIAQNYPGGEKAFVAKMNENAAVFNLEHTNFTDPAGLNDEENGNYTTALDLSRLVSIAMKNSTIVKVVATKQKIITSFSGLSYNLSNLNRLLSEDGVIGVKTGFTEKAGGVLTTAKLENGHIIILVVMKSEDRFLDTQLLLSRISGKISYTSLVYSR